jgi:hypothetical protein
MPWVKVALRALRSPAIMKSHPSRERHIAGTHLFFTPRHHGCELMRENTQGSGGGGAGGAGNGSSNGGGRWSIGKVVISFIISCFLVFMIKNITMKDYNNETKSYLTKIGRADAIDRVVPKTTAVYFFPLLLAPNVSVAHYFSVLRISSTKTN